MQNTKAVWGGILIAVAIGVIALILSLGNASSPSTPAVHAAGSVNGGNVTNFTAVQVSAGFWVGVNQIFSAISGYSELLLGSSGGSVAQTANVGTCNTASSTLFAIAPATAATSTVTIVSFNIGGNATTSSLLVGTSTKSSGLASTDVAAILVNSSNGIASSTTYWTASGNQNGSGGFLAAGSATLTRVLVKPGEFVVGYSTSTATGAGAAGYTPGFSTCTYKVLFSS